MRTLLGVSSLLNTFLVIPLSPQHHTYVSWPCCVRRSSVYIKSNEVAPHWLRWVGVSHSLVFALAAQAPRGQVPKR